jgi:methyl-accepting chemotaxis protein
VQISDEAGKLLELVVPEIQNTAKLVQEIAASSSEQNSGAAQVNAAIQQLNQVTQQNAAASEEMATASEELSSQAEQLKEMVSYFNIGMQIQRSQHTSVKQFASAKTSVAHIQKSPTTKPSKVHISKGIAFKMAESNGDGAYEKY